MSNWLEEEEEKKAKLAQERLIQVTEANALAKVIKDKNEVIHKLIEPFYGICERTNSVKINSLDISKLKIINKQNPEYSSRFCNHSFNIDYGYGNESCSVEISIRKYKGISFTGTNSDKINIVIFNKIREEIRENDKLTYSKEFGLPCDFEETILCRECVIQDIINWSEENMINLIQCFIANSDNFEEFLPGINESLIKKQKEIELREKQIKNINLAKEAKEIDKDNQNASIGSGFLGGLAGGGIGLVLGFILGLFSEIGSCISNGSEKDMNKNDGTIIIFSILICALIGAITAYNSKHKK